MLFVQPRTESQRAMRVLHRVRESLVRDKVKTTNQMHAFLLEFGISMPKCIAVIKRLSTVLAENDLPPYRAQLLIRLHDHYQYLVVQITELERALDQELSRDEMGQHLMTIQGIEPITASVLSFQLGDCKQYGCSRDFAASTGLVPREYSTGSKIPYSVLANVEIKICVGDSFNAPEYLSSESTTSLEN